MCTFYRFYTIIAHLFNSLVYKSFAFTINYDTLLNNYRNTETPSMRLHIQYRSFSTSWGGRKGVLVSAIRTQYNILIRTNFGALSAIRMGCRDIDGLSAIRIENRIRNPHDFFFAISAIRMQKLAHIRYPQNSCAPPPPSWYWLLSGGFVDL